MKLETLQDLFNEQLMDLYSAEDQLIKALPEMAKKASDSDLKKAFEEHLKMTEEQKKRIEEIGKDLDVKLGDKSCVAMEGLVKEGKEIMKEGGSDEAMDAALIAAVQKIEHYEIASYGSLVTYAQALGHKDAEKLLQKTLNEEEKTDERLSKLAEGGINEAALEA